MAVEDFDPIHYDAREAQVRGYRGIVAPWPILALLQYNCSHAVAPVLIRTRHRPRAGLV